VHGSRIVSLLVLAGGVVLVSLIMARERRARALSAGAREVRSALDRTGMAVWEWDSDRDRLHWSGDVRRIYGLPRRTRFDTLEQLLDWIHPDDREAVRSAVAGALENGAAFEVEARTSLSAQGWRWILLQGGI